MIRKIEKIVFFSIFFTGIFSYAQMGYPFEVDSLQPYDPETTWTQTYGGVYADLGNSVQQTSDGGYIITGYTASFGEGNNDIYLVKTDVNGKTLWTKTYGGSGDDVAYSVLQTIDGGYIIAGYTNSFGNGGYDVYLIKTNALGESTWTRCYGQAKDDKGYSVQQITNSGYIITGMTASAQDSGDIYIINTDLSGNVVWTKTYGGQGLDQGYSVYITTDAGYIIAGMKSNHGGNTYQDVYLMKVNVDGDTQWTKTYGGLGLDEGSSVQQTIDGGYIITGMTSYDSSHLSPSLVYLIKTSSNGDSLWAKTFGENGSSYRGYSVQQTQDGGYIITGATGSDVYFIKTDSLGWVMRTKIYGGAQDDGGYNVQQTSDGGYIIAGYTGSFGAGDNDMYLIKTTPIITILTPNGGEVWQGGSTHIINWRPENTPNNTYHFQLLFSSDGGATYSDTIAQNISGQTISYAWNVPMINSNMCRIKLELVNSKDIVISDDISSGDFTIDATSPLIDSTTIWNNTSDPGPYQILTKATDNLSGIDSVILYYQRNEDPAWVLQLMAQIDSTSWFRDSIPAVTLSYDTVRYFIKALDFAFPSNSITDPSNAPNDYYWFIAENLGLGENNRQPESFSLVIKSNPIRARAIFHLVLSADDFVDLRIYDITGKLVDNPIKKGMPKGIHQIVWDPDVSAGVYFYLLRSSMNNRGGKFIFVH